MLKIYVGTEIVLADEMDEVSFGILHKGAKVCDLDKVCMARPGYHVRYSLTDGSTHDIWYLKEAFEGRFREVPVYEASLLKKAWFPSRMSEKC